MLSAGQVWERRHGRHRGARVEILYEILTEHADRRFWAVRSLTAADGAGREMEERDLLGHYRRVHA